jgi:hypothetical protein
MVMNRPPRDDDHDQDEMSPAMEMLASWSRALDRGIIRAHRWATAQETQRRRRRRPPPARVEIPGPRAPMDTPVEEKADRG